MIDLLAELAEQLQPVVDNKRPKRLYELHLHLLQHPSLPLLVLSQSSSVH